MNIKFTELMVQEQTEQLTVEQRAFVETHKKIISYGNIAGKCMVEVARNLKEMRDGKLFKVAGFEEFGEYVEDAVGIKERQAYNYIKVMETYNEQYLAENANLGITKLISLASVSEEEREEISKDIDLEAASARDVDAAVKEVIRERDEKQKQLDIFAAENVNLKAELTAKESARAEIQSAYDEKKKELLETKNKIKDLTDQKVKLENSLKSVKPQVKTEIKTVPDEESKKLAAAEKARADELEQKLRETNAQLAAAKEQKKTIASDELLVFKVKFDDLQRLGEDLKKALGGMSEENAVKCKNAINAVLNGWKEDMQL